MQLHLAGIDLYEYSDGVIESGNKTRLTNLVNEINSLDKNNYSKVTVDNLNVSINEAQILLSASIVSQNMLDNAYLNLSKAKKSLVDITKAKDVLIKLNNLNDKDYSGLFNTAVAFSTSTSTTFNDAAV